MKYVSVTTETLCFIMLRISESIIPDDSNFDVLQQSALSPDVAVTMWERQADAAIATYQARLDGRC